MDVAFRLARGSALRLGGGSLARGGSKRKESELLVRRESPNEARAATREIALAMERSLQAAE